MEFTVKRRPINVSWRLRRSCSESKPSIKGWLRLFKEMEITIKQVEESEFYRNIIEQLKTSSTLQRNFKRVLGSHSSMLMVIYGLGSMDFSYIAQYQLALALLLKRDFSPWIDEVEVFDPAFSPRDVKVFKKLGCKVVPVDEKCRRRVEKPTLFFMPYPHIHLFANVIEANWCPSKINQVIFLSNSLKTIAESNRYRKPKDYSKYMIPMMQYAKCIQKYTKEVELCADYGEPCPEIIYDFSWHFFHVDTDIDMEGLLPGDLTEEKRLKIRRELDEESGPDFLQLERGTKSTYMVPFEKTSDQKPEDWSWLYGHYRGFSKYHQVSYLPPGGWVKLNVGGKGYDESSCAGYGGIFCNDKNELIDFYSGCLGKMDATTATVEAIRHGFRRLQFIMPSIKNLIVVGDELNAIKWVNRGPEPPTRIRNALFEIFYLAKTLNLVVCHLYEEANLQAIQLAKKGSKLPLKKKGFKLRIEIRMRKRTSLRFLSSKDQPRHKVSCKFIWSRINFRDCNSKTSKTHIAEVPGTSTRKLNIEADMGMITALHEDKEVGVDVSLGLGGEFLRLFKEVEITIKEIEESQLYAKLKEQLKTCKTLRQNFKRVLGSNSRISMAIYALGSMDFCFKAQYQLAVAILLKRDFSYWIEEIEVYDPAFSPRDITVLEKLGIKVLTINEKCRREVQKPTLFFMPYAYHYHLGNLVVVVYEALYPCMI